MYKVLLDNTLMCDSRIEELALLNPVVDLEENKAGSFSFTITPDHPKYDDIQRRKSVLQVYKDEELIFSGICIEVGTDFYKRKSVYCEGELTYLNDSIQRPSRYQGITVRGLLEAFIANHNAQVEEAKRFQVGMVTVEDSNDSLYCYTNMESTMECLKEDLYEDMGGFFRVRHENGVKYIDYLADSQRLNSQVIKLGKNLMDFTSNLDSSEIATAVIPLGTSLDEESVEGLQAKLTIEAVNDGKDYVFNQEAVNAFGWIYKTLSYPNVTKASNLKSKAEAYLSNEQFENIVIEAQAIDLHQIDKSVEPLKLSDSIRVVSEPHGMDRTFRLTKQQFNLNNPEKDTVRLGVNAYVGLSAQTSEANKQAANAIIKATEESMNAYKEAVANATALLTSAMGGYVYKTNSELYIMDTDNPATAQKVWRWNINGLGYSSTGVNGEYALAMTMDGSIVADFITAGVLKGLAMEVGNKFSVSTEGVLKCAGAEIGGVLSCSSGSSMGGFKTDSNSLFKGTWGAEGTTPPEVYICTGSNRAYDVGESGLIKGWAIGAGDKFGVTKDGALYSSMGKIGGWTIEGSSLLGEDDNGNEIKISPWGVTGYIYKDSSADSRSKVTMAWEGILTAAYAHFFG